jgi:hypothetical protein
MWYLYVWKGELSPFPFKVMIKGCLLINQYTKISSIFGGSEDLRQMSEFPPPNGVGGLHSCILRGSYKSAFLHSKEEIQSLTDLPQCWWAKCSQDCSLPTVTVLTIAVHLRKPTKLAHSQWETPPPRVKTSIKILAFTWVGSYRFLGSAVLL